MILFEKRQSGLVIDWLSCEKEVWNELDGTERAAVDDSSTEGEIALFPS